MKWIDIELHTAPKFILCKLENQKPVPEGSDSWGIRF